MRHSKPRNQVLTKAPDPNLFGMLYPDPYIMNTGFSKLHESKILMKIKNRKNFTNMHVRRKYDSWLFLFS